MRYLKTSFVENIPVDNDSLIYKNKKLFIKKKEIRRDTRPQKFKYERSYFKKAHLIKMSGNYSIDFTDKFALLVSVDRCLDAPFDGQTSYNILLEDQLLTIMAYHIERIIDEE